MKILGFFLSENLDDRDRLSAEQPDAFSRSIVKFDNLDVQDLNKVLVTVLVPNSRLGFASGMQSPNAVFNSKTLVLPMFLSFMNLGSN